MSIFVTWYFEELFDKSRGYEIQCAGENSVRLSLPLLSNNPLPSKAVESIKKTQERFDGLMRSSKENDFKYQSKPEKEPDWKAKK